MGAKSKAIALFLLLGLSTTVAACEGGESETETPAEGQVSPEGEEGEGGEGGEG